MNKYNKFMLEATINTASGFGRPKAARTVKKPTKEELGRWRARSDKFREDYLKKHPNSKFKNVPVKGSIVTRSKKVSSKPWAIKMTETGLQALKDIGLKGKNLAYVSKKNAVNSLHKFLNSNDRAQFVETSKKVFSNYYNKLKPEDRATVDKEAEIINNSKDPPSRSLLRKAGKGLLFGLVGVAAGAAMFSGLIPADLAIFLGVKVLDTSFETVRHSMREPLSTLIMANTIHKFFQSKDSDDYAEDTISKMKDRGIEVDEDEDTKKIETDLHDNSDKPDGNDNEAAVKKAVSKQLGDSFDHTKYYLDEDGNLKRKR